jgi:hypothetical protein
MPLTYASRRRFASISSWKGRDTRARLYSSGNGAQVGFDQSGRPPADTAAVVLGGRPGRRAWSECARSWAGIEDDVRIGEELVALVRPFIVNLRDSGLARKTIRRHLDNMWAIGGEIIRSLHSDEERRRWTGERLLLDAVENDEAPLIRGATRAEQESCDATARKLRKYLAR